MIKIIALILYGFLAYVGVSKPLTLEANLSIALLTVLLVAHVAECFVYRDLIRKAPGGTAWNAFNVLLFGVFHVSGMRRQLRETEGE